MHDVERIPFNRITLTGNELPFVSDAIARSHLSGDGYFSKQVHTLLESLLRVPKVLLTTNCTHALEIAALLLDIQPGDEVLLPSFTFVSTANAFVLRGARPVFIDIRPDTLNLDESLIEGAITPRTKAIVTVHYAGVGSEMDEITRIALKHRLRVVEDNAHGLFGKYRGRLLGTIGTFGTQSFHETKNFTCGEGGAIVINDASYIEDAEMIREKGTNRARFFRGQVDKYTWVSLGSSYLPSDLLAAFLLAQLQSREAVQLRRGQIWSKYYENLTEWARANGVRLPFVPEHCEQSFHMFYLLMPNFHVRARFIDFMSQEGINALFHYLPLHTSPMAKALDVKAECPVTSDISDRLVRLPFFNGLRDHEQDRVIETILRFSADGQ